MGISENLQLPRNHSLVKFMREQLMKHYDKSFALLFAFLLMKCNCNLLLLDGR